MTCQKDKNSDSILIVFIDNNLRKKSICVWSRCPLSSLSKRCPINQVDLSKLRTLFTDFSEL